MLHDSMSILIVLNRQSVFFLTCNVSFSYYIETLSLLLKSIGDLALLPPQSGSGLWEIKFKAVDCPTGQGPTGSIQFRFTGSNENYFKIQALNTKYVWFFSILTLVFLFLFVLYHFFKKIFNINVVGKIGSQVESVFILVKLVILVLPSLKKHST